LRERALGALVLSNHANIIDLSRHWPQLDRHALTAPAPDKEIRLMKGP